MASWVLRSNPWSSLLRSQTRFGFSVPSLASKLPLLSSKTFFSTTLSLSEEIPSEIAFRKIQYPSAPPDPSLFEEYDDEYAVEDTAVIDSRVGPPCFAIRNLISEKKYDEAVRMINEFRETGVHIWPSFVYGKLCHRSLLNPSLSAEEKAEKFKSFWDLFPNSDTANRWQLGYFCAVRDVLLSYSPAPDMDLITWFAVSASKKGYMGRLHVHIIPYIFRHAPAAVSTKCLLDMLQADQKFADAPLKQHNLHRAKHPISIAIRTLAVAGRLDDAVKFLKQLGDARLSTHDSTYEFLVKKVMEKERHDLMVTLNEYQRSGILFNSLERLRISGYIVPASDSTLREVVEYLVTSLRTHNNRMPVRLLADTIRICQEHDQHSVIETLRQETYKHGWHASITKWISAHMLLHFDEREYEKMFSIFNRHFYALGVPRPFVDIAVQKSRGSSKIERRYPTDSQTQLIWRGFVESCRDVKKVDSLYAELIDQVESSYASLSGLPIPDTIDPNRALNPHALPIPNAYTAAHFHPFIKFYLRKVSIQRAYQVLADMSRLWIAPSVECFTPIIGYLSVHGHVDSLIQMFERMEKSKAKRKAEKQIEDTMYVPRFLTDLELSSIRKGKTEKEWRFPAPDEYMYYAALKPLVDQHKTGNAMKVFRTMLSAEGGVARFKEGKFTPLNDLLVQLKSLVAPRDWKSALRSADSTSRTEELTSTSSHHESHWQ
ncbi:hypothetical protein ABKN59_004775 [Abortiporus biennis]